MRQPLFGIDESKGAFHNNKLIPLQLRRNTTVTCGNFSPLLFEIRANYRLSGHKEGNLNTSR